MIAETPGLELWTDGNGGVWLRYPEPWPWEGFRDAEGFFLDSMPMIEALFREGPRIVGKTRLAPGPWAGLG